MRKLAVVVAILFGLTVQRSSSERIFLGGVYKSYEFKQLNSHLVGKAVRADIDFSTFHNLLSEFAETTAPTDSNVPVIELAKQMADLTEVKAREAFCEPENLAKLEEIVFLSVNEKRPPIVPSFATTVFSLSKILGRYIESHNCTEKLQAKWDELNQSEVFNVRYKSLIGLDKSNLYFSRTIHEGESNEVKEFDGAWRFKWIMHSRNKAHLFLSGLSRFLSHTMQLSGVCAHLMKEEVSRVVLEPLINYSAGEITTSNASMLKWAARLQTCKTLFK